MGSATRFLVRFRVSGIGVSSELECDVRIRTVDPEDTEGSSTLVELSMSSSVSESLGIAQERRCSISKSGSFTESSLSSFRVELEESDEDVLSVSEEQSVVESSVGFSIF